MFIVSKLFSFATLEFHFWLPGSMKKFRLSLSYLFACDFRRVAETVLQQIFFAKMWKKTFLWTLVPLWHWPEHLGSLPTPTHQILLRNMSGNKKNLENHAIRCSFRNCFNPPPPASAVKFIVPDWGDKVNSDIGLSNWPANRLADRYDNPVPKSTMFSLPWGKCSVNYHICI